MEKAQEYREYRVVYTIDSSDGWAMGNHPTNIRVYEKDGSAPTQNGLTMEDVGEEEWDKIQRAIDRWMNPDCGIDWSMWDTGIEDYTIIHVQ